MNAHQRRKARRQFESGLSLEQCTRCWFIYQRQEPACPFCSKITGPSIADLQQAGKLPTTNQGKA